MVFFYLVNPRSGFLTCSNLMSKFNKFIFNSEARSTHTMKTQVHPDETSSKLGKFGWPYRTKWDSLVVSESEFIYVFDSRL